MGGGSASCLFCKVLSFCAIASAFPRALCTGEVERGDVHWRWSIGPVAGEGVANVDGVYYWVYFVHGCVLITRRTRSGGNMSFWLVCGKEAKNLRLTSGE